MIDFQDKYARRPDRPWWREPETFGAIIIVLVLPVAFAVWILFGTNFLHRP